MKQRVLFKLLKECSPWIFLLCISDVFFIFTAWLAYPETFLILLISMIGFSVICIAFGILCVMKRKVMQEKAFYNFLREPSLEHEDALVQSVGEFHEEKVNYLANKLRTFNDKLNETGLKNQEYEEFIESWVHEIKTPISLITLVLANRQDEMSELVHQRLEHARINISDDIEQILFYARLQASHVDYCLERVWVKPFIDDILLEFQSLLDEKEVKINSQIEAIHIICDKRSFQFIITQILVNAIKYSNKEVQSFIYIKTGLTIGKNRYSLAISDNGIGVLSSDLPFIFDKGFTGDNSNRSQSTGIGLYLVKKLCDELNIEIEVESEFGKGFKIQLLFPIVEDV